MSGIAIDVRRAAAFLLAALWIALTATFVRAESLAQGAFAPWRSEPPDTVDVVLRPLARELTTGRTQNLIQIRTTTDNQGNRIPGKVDGGETKLIELYRVNAAQ